MFRVRDLKNGLYQIHKEKGPAFEGPLRCMLTVALNWGLQENDLVAAIMEMTDEGHDYAEFGRYGTLIFTASDSKRMAS